MAAMTAVETDSSSSGVVARSGVSSGAWKRWKPPTRESSGRSKLDPVLGLALPLVGVVQGLWNHRRIPAAFERCGNVRATFTGSADTRPVRLLVNVALPSIGGASAAATLAPMWTMARGLPCNSLNG